MHMYVWVRFVLFVFNTNAAENMMLTKVLVLSQVEPAKNSVSNNLNNHVFLPLSLK